MKRTGVALSLYSPAGKQSKHQTTNINIIPFHLYGPWSIVFDFIGFEIWEGPKTFNNICCTSHAFKDLIVQYITNLKTFEKDESKINLKASKKHKSKNDLKMFDKYKTNTGLKIFEKDELKIILLGHCGYITLLRYYYISNAYHWDLISEETLVFACRTANPPFVNFLLSPDVGFLRSTPAAFKAILQSNEQHDPEFKQWFYIFKKLVEHKYVPYNVLNDLILVHSTYEIITLPKEFIEFIVKCKKVTSTREMKHFICLKITRLQTMLEYQTSSFISDAIDFITPDPAVMSSLLQREFISGMIKHSSDKSLSHYLSHVYRYSSNALRVIMLEEAIVLNNVKRLILVMTVIVDYGGLVSVYANIHDASEDLMILAARCDCDLVLEHFLNVLRWNASIDDNIVLRTAVKYNNIKCVRLLLAYETVSPNDMYYDVPNIYELELYRSPLALALINMCTEGFEDGAVQCINELMRNPRYDSLEIRRELFKVCKTKTSEVVIQILANQPVITVEDINKLLYNVCSLGFATNLKQLLLHPYAPECTNAYLVQVCQLEYYKLVKVLLDDGRCDATYNGNQCLVIACTNLDYSSFCYLILVKNFNPTININAIWDALYPIRQVGAITPPLSKIVLFMFCRLISDERVRTEENCRRVLLGAISNNCKDTVKRLLYSKFIADIRMNDFEGLKWAIEYGNEKILRRMLSEEYITINDWYYLLDYTCCMICDGKFNFDKVFDILVLLITRNDQVEYFSNNSELIKLQQIYLKTNSHPDLAEFLERHQGKYKRKI